MRLRTFATLLVLLTGLVALIAAPGSVPARAAARPAAVSPPAAHAGPPTAVELGDSYMSGEGARWLGNSADPGGSRDGTDRACSPSISNCSSYDPAKVYIDTSYADGCHRADVAQIFSSHLLGLTPLNIACSGAVSSDLYLKADGGTKDHGETPQSDQLLAAARTHDIRFIAVMIGGNDLDFAPIVSACFTAYETHGTPCSKSEASQVAPDKLHAAALKVARAIDEIRKTMRLAGYHVGDYRMVLETYPNVIPHAADDRYSESDPQRSANGCPFYDVDLNWAQDVAGPSIDAMVRAAAAARGVPLLDMRRAFVGHEICAKTDAAATALATPDAAGSEWGRGVSPTNIADAGGSTQELFHPDAYGHMAFGTCLREFFAAPVGQNYTCSGRAGITPSQMALAPAEPLPTECRLGAPRLTRVLGTRYVEVRSSCTAVAGLEIAAFRGARIAESVRDLAVGSHVSSGPLPRNLTRGVIRVVLTLRGTGGDVHRSTTLLRVR